MTSPFPHRIGRIRRAHGLDGSLVLQHFRPLKAPLRPKAQHGVVALTQGDVERVHHLCQVRPIDPLRTLIRLEGVLDRDSAEAQVGAFVDVDPARLPEALTDRWDRLHGAQVYWEDGQPAGQVEAFEDFGAHPLLDVSGMLVPAVDAFVLRVEPGPPPVITLARVPGLVEAAAPSPSASPSDPDVPPP